MQLYGSYMLPFLALSLLLFWVSSPVLGQASTKKKNAPIADEYTKRLVKEMQNQG